MNLNERVAKAKGWVKCDCESECCNTWTDNEGAMGELDDWSGDLNAAWKLVEEMGPDVFASIGYAYSRWSFSVLAWTDPKMGDKGGCDIFTRRKPTEAICLAYLAWVGSK